MKFVSAPSSVCHRLQRPNVVYTRSACIYSGDGAANARFIREYRAATRARLKYLYADDIEKTLWSFASSTTRKNVFFFRTRSPGVQCGDSHRLNRFIRRRVGTLRELFNGRRAVIMFFLSSYSYVRIYSYIVAVVYLSNNIRRLFETFFFFLKMYKRVYVGSHYVKLTGFFFFRKYVGPWQRNVVRTINAFHNKTISRRRSSPDRQNKYKWRYDTRSTNYDSNNSLFVTAYDGR